MFEIVICLVLLMCTVTILSSVLYVLMVEGMSVVANVMLSLMSVMSPPHALCNLAALTVVKLCTCVVNKQFVLLEFVFDSVYVDLQYDEISFTFTAGSVSLCCAYRHVVVFGVSVSLWWYPCGCGGCYVCDACTVVCVSCVYAERV